MSSRVKEGFSKFHGEREFTSTGNIGPTSDNPWYVGGENNLRIAVENVGGGNTIVVYGRIRNQTNYSTLATITGGTNGTTVDISLIDEVYFDCTVYSASGGTPRLVASGFFKPSSSSGSSDTASNLGSGEGVFASKVGPDFQFKSLIAGSGITLNSTSTDITISANASPRLSVVFNTTIATAVGDLVRVTGANTVEAITDNLDTTIPNGIFGVAFDKPTSTTVEVIFMGILDVYSGLTVGQALYISTLGVPTHTAPLTGTLQEIGFAVSTTEIFFNLKTAIRRA